MKCDFRSLVWWRSHLLSFAGSQVDKKSFSFLFALHLGIQNGRPYWLREINHHDLFRPAISLQGGHWGGWHRSPWDPMSVTLHGALFPGSPGGPGTKTSRSSLWMAATRPGGQKPRLEVNIPVIPGTISCDLTWSDIEWWFSWGNPARIY